MRINPPTNIKRIQFLGSPFRGERLKELKVKNAEELGKNKSDTDQTPREFINIAKMHEAGMSKKQILEKVNQILREKGILKSKEN